MEEPNEWKYPRMYWQRMNNDSRPGTVRIIHPNGKCESLGIGTNAEWYPPDWGYRDGEKITNPKVIASEMRAYDTYNMWPPAEFIGEIK